MGRDSISSLQGNSLGGDLIVHVDVFSSNQAYQIMEGGRRRAVLSEGVLRHRFVWNRNVQYPIIGPFSQTIFGLEVVKEQRRKCSSPARSFTIVNQS